MSGVVTVTCMGCGATRRDDAEQTLVGSVCMRPGCGAPIVDTADLIGEEAARQLRYRVGFEVPPCDDECGGRQRAYFIEAGIDAIVTAVQPLIETAYPSSNLVCPHGVTWFTAPTSEQIAAWVRDGVA